MILGLLLGIGIALCIGFAYSIPLFFIIDVKEKLEKLADAPPSGFTRSGEDIAQAYPKLAETADNLSKR